MSEVWPSVPLGEAIQHRKEFIEIDDERTYKRCRVQLHAKGIVLRDKVKGSEIKTKKQQVVKTGEFLVAEIDAKVGGFGIVPADLEGAIVSSHYFLYQINEALIDKRFLGYYIRTPAFHDQVGAQGSTNYAAIRPHHVLDYTVPLPPLSEQRRIVGRLEHLAGKVEEARGLRHESTTEVEALSVSARHEVFSELGERIQPVRLDSVANTRLGKMLSKEAKKGTNPTPYMRNANVQWDRLDLSSVYEMDFTEEERRKFALQRGDILVCEGGDIGKSAIWNDEIPGCCYQKALHRVRVDREKLLPRFTLYHIFWAAEQGHFEDIKTQTTIPHLTGVKFNAYPVFVPPLGEQTTIVEQLDSLTSKADSLKQLQAQARAELDALLPSILDKAFRGEL